MSRIFRIIKAAIQGKEKNFTSGSINRAIVYLSIPMILEMIMESLFAVVDVFFVSQVSVDAVSTVGLTESVITLVYSIAIGLSMAATAIVARRIGEKNAEGASRSAVQAILIGVSISVVIGVTGFIFAADILRMMGGSEELIAEGVGYTQVAFATNVVIMLLFLLNGIFRGAGDASLAMASLWVANIINIILDPMFIFGIGPFPELGVMGAAVATSIGRGLGVVFQLVILLRGWGIIKIAARYWRPNWQLIKKMVKIGSSGTMQFLISSASWIFLMRIIAIFGSEAIAGYTISIRLIIFTILPAWGLANAAATLVGQNLGAGKPERAEQSVWKAAFYNMLFLLSVSIVFFTFARPLMSFFTDVPTVIDAGVLSLRIICVGYVFFAYGMVISQAFNGAGDTRTPMFINLFCFWMLEIPLSYFLSVTLGMGLAGVCWAIAGSETVLAILAVIIFRKGRWKKISI
jgi:putative MATE family efflux protein